MLKVARYLADLLLLAHPAWAGDGLHFISVAGLTCCQTFVWSCTNTALCHPPLGGLVMAPGVPSTKA